MGIFFLDKATAEIRNMMEVEETYEFEYWLPLKILNIKKYRHHSNTTDHHVTDVQYN
jgi:hypothetical protein